MHPRTTATLEKLEQAEWFANVGTYAGIEDRSKIVLLSSWQEAIQHCSSVEWENLGLEAANQYRERLLERSKDRYNIWNEIVEQLKPTTIPFVKRKIEAVVRVHNLPQVFEDTVQWDILHVCMEAEYADVYHPGYYASQAYWYVKGHFPCGWDGDFPQGKLIIY
jgi:hypothetical protein